ncbi:hypothetical protein MMC11_003261 [Xylographa trunciseda]|nr:hypothetical protein [Xylographa trunciseda]
MPSPSTWTSPSMRTPVQRSMEHNSVLGHNRSNSRKGSGRKLPSGRLTCHAWFMHGVCNKAPGQCQYSHMHMGQGVSPIPSAEIHGQPIEEEIICQTDFLTPVSNVRHYEAHSPELEGFESHSDGPLVVGPRSCSQPYEMRAKIYSIVALSNSLQSMVQNPQTPVSNHSGARRSPAISPLSVEMNKARDLIQELHVEMQTYHTVVERLQPRLLDFAEPLRNAAHAMNITQRDSSLIELIRMAADEVRVIIGRHRVAEWLNVDKKEP